MAESVRAAAGDGLAAAARMSANLGKRCAGTYFVATAASELCQRLQSRVPSLSERLAALDPVTLAVADIKGAKGALMAARRQQGRGAHGSDEAAAGTVTPFWLLVDNSAIGSFTSPAIMRGADVVIDDLSSVPGAPGGVCALSLSRDICQDAKARAALEQAIGQLKASVARVPDMAGYNELCVKRNHNAQAVVADLTCHPAVGEVRYPGLVGDPAREIALHTFEHGFGPWVLFCVAGVAEAQAALQVAQELGTGGEAQVRSELFSAPDDKAALRLVVGDEDPLAIVMWLEAVLDPA